MTMSMPDYEWLQRRDSIAADPADKSGDIPREMIVFAVVLVLTALVLALL